MSGGLFYATYTFLLAPLNNKYAAARESLMQTQTKVAEMKQRAIELPRLIAEMKQLELQVTELEKLLPREKEIPQLLRTVTKTAQHHQLKITQISPQPVVSLANYNELPFQLSVQGPYHAIAAFN
jgi:type IV pilus assembly protein PilO